MQSGDVCAHGSVLIQVFAQVRFDGSWLHGAPVSLLPPPAHRPKHKGKRQKRISLLVNVWLAHKPDLAAPLPTALAAKLSPCLSSVPFRLAQPSTLPVVVTSPCGTGSKKRHVVGSGEGSAGDTNASACEKQEFTWPIAQVSDSEGATSLWTRLPTAAIVALAQSQAGSSVEIHLSHGDAFLVET